MGMTVGLTHYLVLAGALFSIGLVGVIVSRKSIITMLMSIELMLLAVNINFVTFSHFLDDLVGQVFVMFILTVAAAEAAIGLAIMVIYFRQRNTLDVADISSMKG